ncbi:M28 family peptidase [Streptosporangium sp. NPDC002524]|uniref:M28 family peptidase n=1 Tax=Streptosporangium sp. NPDC002524 TaxID=3154537 RepID=UPI003324171D
MTGKLIDVPRRVVAGVAGLLVLAGMVVLTAMGESTMQPLPASAPAGEFSAGRALEHLERFAAEPRPLGSPASDRARDYLVGRLRAEGMRVEVHRAVGARSAAGLATFGRVENIVATLPGRDPTGTVMVAAHYDSAAMGPGASDDGAAVAAMLETARALRVQRDREDTQGDREDAQGEREDAQGDREGRGGQGNLRNDLVFLMTDGEEDGVLGAEAFVREHPLARKGGVLLNWEARGVGGPSLMFETSRNNARLVETFAGAVPHPRGDSSMVELYRMLPNNTDFTPLVGAGFTGMNFAYIERSSRYHTADDSIANLDRGSLQHHGSNMLALTRALGGAALPTLVSGGDVTYFRILGTMVTYPGHLVGPLAALAVLALAGLILLARRRGLVSVPRVLAGAASALLPLGLSVVLAQGMWELLVAWRPAYDTMGGLLHRPQAYQAAVAAMAGLALLSWYLPLRRRIGPAALAAGALAWPAALGALCAWAAPGASFVFTLPALGCALGGIVALLLPRSPVWRIAALTSGAVASALLLPALARNALDGMGLALGGAGALVFAVFGLTLLPLAELPLPALRRGLGRRAAVAAPSVAVAVTVSLVGLGLAVDGFDEGHPRRTHLAYVLNADTRVARWVSADADPVGWTRRYVSGRDAGALPPGYARGGLWTGPAPAIRAGGPRVTVLSRSEDGGDAGDGGDTVTLRVTAGRAVRGVTLRVDHPITGATAAVAGSGPVTVAVTGVRAGTWPGEVRFRDLPRGGAEITLRVPRADRLRVTAIAETYGLSTVPGYVPRPPGLVASTREDGDLVAVTRTYDL